MKRFFSDVRYANHFGEEITVFPAKFVLIILPVLIFAASIYISLASRKKRD